MPDVIDSFSGRYRWLSNFHPAPLAWRDLVFPTLEHAFQWEKMDTEQGRVAVISVPPDLTCTARRWTTPGEAKRAARRHHMRSDWEQIKIDVMHELLRRKFADPDLRQRLIDTGDAKLIEGNNWNDRFWGVCNGIGENHLGRLLMLVRLDVAGKP